MTRLRIGVIGPGIMGEQYVRIYAAHPRATVVALCGRTPARVNKLADAHGIPGRYAEVADLLADPNVEAVVVATPDDAHAEPVRMALEAGKHVLCEKPFTTSLAEADSLLALSRMTGVKLQVAFNHRWLSSYYQGFRAIRDGAIGRPVAGYARKNDTIYVPTEMLKWAARSSPIHFLGAHDIDLMRWFFGSEPTAVYARGARGVLAARGIDTWDLVQANLSFDNGAFATIESAWIYPNTFPTIVDSFVEVVGSNGHLHFDRKRESIEMSTATAFTYPKTFLSADVFGRLRGAFVECLSDFVQAVLDDTPPHVGAFDGRQVTAVLDAIDRSLKSGMVESVVKAI
jgi:predicted dehydrogenase